MRTEFALSPLEFSTRIAGGRKSAPGKSCNEYLNQVTSHVMRAAPRQVVFDYHSVRTSAESKPTQLNMRSSSQSCRFKRFPSRTGYC